MLKKYCFKAIFPFLLISFLIGSSTNIFAESNPAPPTEFEAEVEESGNSYNVVLSWKKSSEGDEPDDFNIYQADGETEITDNFAKIETVKSNNNKDDYTLKISKMDEGTYSFYVTSVIDEDESDPSDFLTVVVEGSGEEYSLKISSNPEKKADVGVQWTYTLEVETDAPQDCSVLYEILEGPEGMEIDMSSGTVSWTPDEKGNFDVELKAYLECDETIEDTQSFKLNVSGSNEKLTLRIKSKAESKASLNEEYIYTPEIETNAEEDCPVLFELLEGPDDLVFDEATGSMTWTPTEEGAFDIEYRAYLECDNTVDDNEKIKLMVKDESDYFVRIISRPEKSVIVGEDFEYQLSATTNAPEDCPVIFELENEPEGMMLFESSSTMSTEPYYSVTWTPEETGNYKFEIKAYLECNEAVIDVQKINLKVDKGKKQFIRIVSRPDNHGEVGELYTYQIFAETNAAEDCPVLFEFSEDSPEEWGLIENSSVTWTEAEGYSMTFTAEEPGVYQGFLNATLECDESVTDKQRITINIMKKSKDVLCAFIKGHVEDEEGELVEEGKVMLFRVDAASTDDETKQVFKEEFFDGEFEVEVSEGAYVLKVNAHDMVEEWYNDAEDVGSAEKIELTCGADVNLDIILSQTPEEKDPFGENTSVTFTGSVMSEDEEPLIATVEYIPVDWMYGKPGAVKPIISKYATETDEEGNYEIELPAQFTYIALAIPENGSGFMAEYWEDVLNPMEATLLETSSTFSTIDFALAESGEYYNGFGGAVVDMDGNPLESRIVAFLIEPKEDIEQQYNYTQSVETDEEGNYLTANVIPGDYVVFSIPVDKEYAPGFYMSDGAVIKKWKEADLVTVDDMFLSEDYDLKHEIKSGIKGIAHMKGNLKKTNKGIIKSKGGGYNGNSIQGVEEDLPGAFVYIVNVNQEVVDYTFTDNLGDFDIVDIPQGAFTLVADKVGLEPYEEIFEVDYSNLLLLNVDANLENIETSIEELFNDINLDIRIYPVPTSGITNLEINSDQFTANISLYNMMGIKLLDLSKRLNQSGNVFSLDLNEYQSGLYILRVETEGIFKTAKIRIVK